MLITLAHQLYHAIYDVTLGVDFLAHWLAEWVDFTFAGMLLMSSVALVHNWSIRRG